MNGIKNGGWVCFTNVLTADQALAVVNLEKFVR